MFKLDNNDVNISQIPKYFVDMFLFTNGFKKSFKNLGDDNKHGEKIKIGNDNFGIILKDVIDSKLILFQIVKFLGKSTTRFIPIECDHLIRMDRTNINYNEDSNILNCSIMIDFYEGKKKYKKEKYQIKNNNIVHILKMFGYLKNTIESEFIIHSYNGSSIVMLTFDESEQSWFLKREFRIENKDCTKEIEKIIDDNNIKLSDHITFDKGEDIEPIIQFKFS